MCVMFSPANSIKHIYHSNKYLVRCLWKACSNTGSPSFLSAQAIVKPNLFLYEYLNISQT